MCVCVCVCVWCWIGIRGAIDHLILVKHAQRYAGMALKIDSVTGHVMPSHPYTNI